MCEAAFDTEEHLATGVVAGSLLGNSIQPPDVVVVALEVGSPQGLLSRRSMPLSRRCRAALPDDAGIGATLAKRVKVAPK